MQGALSIACPKANTGLEKEKLTQPLRIMGRTMDTGKGRGFGRNLAAAGGKLPS